MSSDEASWASRPVWSWPAPGTSDPDAMADPKPDDLAVEEPLEIRLGSHKKHGEQDAPESVAITMRTPGQDVELALGFLVGEGILRSPEEVHHAAHDPAFCRSGESSNVLLVQLAAGVDRDTERLRRHFYTSSSCGVCGKGSLEAVRAVLADAGAGNPEPDPTYPCWDAAIIRNLPKRLRGLQGTFRRTGGLHAAALVAQDGHIVLAREDVGRHNAVDKLIGHAFMAGLLPLKDHLLLLSGRASFELVQKAIAAGIPGIAAVGAPSTLAVDLASANGRTLLGFVRDHRFNCYAGPGRLQADHAISPAPPA